MIWGRHDPYLLVKHASQQRRGLPSARIAIFGQSGHWPFADSPERTRRLLVPFLLRAQAQDRGGPQEGRRVSGTPGDDVLVGTAGDDVIDCSSGNDRADGRGDDDVSDRGSGNDVVIGGDGDDTLRGASSDDRLEGGEGQDLLDGGGGNDRLEGGPGDDRLRPGSGPGLERRLSVDAGLVGRGAAVRQRPATGSTRSTPPSRAGSGG